MRDRSLAGDATTVCGVGALVVLLAAILGLGLAGAAAAASTSVQLKTTIDGTSVAGSSAAHPVTLRPNRPAQVDIEVTNEGSSDVTLSSVSLTGVVAGLTFFSYQTSVNLTLGPSQSTHLRYSLDLTGLDGQATGLIPARIAVADSHRHQLASQSFVSDVRGSLDSVYGLFGLALLALTAAAIAGVVWAIATHRMPRNRWRRGLRVMTAGLGIGLVLVFTLSAFRVWVPSNGRWLVTVLILGAVFFAIGYLTPTPASDQDEEELDESEFAAPGSAPAGDGTDAADSADAADTAVPSAGEGTS